MIMYPACNRHTKKFRSFRHSFWFSSAHSPCRWINPLWLNFSISARRIYNGPKSKLQYGFAYSYLTRDGWYGIGGAPRRPTTSSTPASATTSVSVSRRVAIAPK